jgi:uncharacterized membrane protein (UPF0127 family)
VVKLRYTFGIVALFLSSFCIFLVVPFFGLPSQKKKINILDKEICAWVASSPQQRERGLQNIVWLPKSIGMLFTFSSPKKYCFWNKNTWLKLKVLFIREGKIVQESLLLPFWQGAMTVCPEEPVDSVLELVE